MAGAAGLEPVTSAVTGQRSNQLSYAPALGLEKIRNHFTGVKRNSDGRRNQLAIKVRAADAKEVGVGNPAEETYCHPDKFTLFHPSAVCQYVIGRDIRHWPQRDDWVHSAALRGSTRMHPGLTTRRSVRNRADLNSPRCPGIGRGGTKRQPACGRASQPITAWSQGALI